MRDGDGLGHASARQGKGPEHRQRETERGETANAAQHVTAPFSSVQLDQAVEPEALVVDEVVQPGQGLTDRRDLPCHLLIHPRPARPARAQHEPSQEMRGDEPHGAATHPPARPRIAETEVRERAREVLDGLVVAADAVERLAQLSIEHRALQRSKLLRRDLRVRGFGPAIVLQGLGVGRHAARLVTRLEQIRLRLLPILRERVVVGQHAREFVHAIGEHSFHRLGHAAVDGAAALGEDAPVGRFLHQRVLEDVLQLGQLLPQADQLSVLELAKAAVHGVAGLRNRLEDSQKEAAADH